MLNLLRESMKRQEIDVYIVPTSDPHQSEYLPDHWKVRERLSGFTGSAGNLVITRDGAGLWTDGRYFLQAENELRGSGIDLFKLGEEGVPSLDEWIYRLEDYKSVGIDGKLFSAKQVKQMDKRFQTSGKTLKIDCDLVSEIWTDRPMERINTVFLHDVEYSGMEREQKLDAVRGKMKELGADYYLISSLDDIAWLYNLRGRDISCNPVVVSYALITMDSADFYVDRRKISPSVRLELESAGVEVREYKTIESSLQSIKSGKIYLDDSKVNAYIYGLIDSSVKKIEGDDIVRNIKCIKNGVEIRNHKNAQLRDSISMVKFLFWLENTVRERGIRELEVIEKINSFRKHASSYIEPSFETIVGYRENGAIVHYKADEKSNKLIGPSGLLLIDSGGQYMEGTTDITRTVSMGEPTSDEKRDYTLVLKGHIALSEFVFPEGTTGCKLDAVARAALWADGKDYKHGTGHGIGNLLSVHEGPQSISPKCNRVELSEGMLITNEPGYYRAGMYGIRIENILLIRKHSQSEYGKYLYFETMTYCPLELNLIDADLLDEREKKWINSYHSEVYRRVAPYLEYGEQFWLKRKTSWI